MTDSAAPRPEASGEDLGNLLLDVLPPDRSTLGNLTARKALSREAGREIQKDEFERVRDHAFDLGLITKGGGRGGSIALEEGIEGGSRYEAPAVGHLSCDAHNFGVWKLVLCYKPSLLKTSGDNLDRKLCSCYVHPNDANHCNVDILNYYSNVNVVYRNSYVLSNVLECTKL